MLSMTAEALQEERCSLCSPPCTVTCHLQLLFNISWVIVNCDFHHSEVLLTNPKQDQNTARLNGTWIFFPETSLAYAAYVQYHM